MYTDIDQQAVVALSGFVFQVFLLLLAAQGWDPAPPKIYFVTHNYPVLSVLRCYQLIFGNLTHASCLHRGDRSRQGGESRQPSQGPTWRQGRNGFFNSSVDYSACISTQLECISRAAVHQALYLEQKKIIHTIKNKKWITKDRRKHKNRQTKNRVSC